MGAGISGGEEGTRYGPSIMPGGSPVAWYVNYDFIADNTLRPSVTICGNKVAELYLVYQ